MSASLPEIANLTALLAVLTPKSVKAFAGIEIANAYAAIIGSDGPDSAYRELFRSIGSLSSVVCELPAGGQKIVAQSVIKRLEDLFSISTVSRPYDEFLPRNRANIGFILETLPLFGDLKFDLGGFIASSDNIKNEIESLKGKIAKFDSVSDASKAVLIAQMSLLENSLARFSLSGVGPFRDSFFTIYGRIRLQLDADPLSAEVDKKELIEGVLRVYSLIQMGGDILKLGGPVVAGLLSAPKP